MTETLPIIFVHRSPADYLVYSAAQARHTNPHSPIIALLDYEDALVSRYAEVVNLHDYLEDVREFDRDYINFSNLNYDYTCFCCQRWIILRNFARARGIRQFIYIDSDVMCYADLTEDIQPYRDASISYAGGSAHTMYVEDFEQFEEFCAFMINRFHEDSRVIEMYDYYKRHKETNRFGGIQDMEHWIAFDKSKGERFGNFAMEKEGVVISTHAKIWDENLKKELLFPFEWKNDQPFGIDRYSNNYVRYSTIHFQGAFKKHIASSFTGDKAIGRNIATALVLRNASKKIPGVARVLDAAKKVTHSELLTACHIQYRPKSLTLSK